MAAQSSQALIVAATAAMYGKEKLEARFLSLCMKAGVSDALMEKMGESGLVSVLLLVNTATSKDALQAMFKAPPFDLNSGGFLTMLELGKITSVYVAAMTTSEVQAKADAERVLQNLPPTINPLDMDTARKRFLKQYPKVDLSRAHEPSKPYFERKMLEVETCFEVESLTEVTNRTQLDINRSTPPDVGVDLRTGCFKTSTKHFAVPMPSTPEGLLARLNLMGICFCYLRQRFPGKGVLRSVEPLTYYYYVEWLLVPKVRGKATLGLDMKPVATRTIMHVLIYDMAIRTRMVALMNEGVDLDTALEAAKKDDDIRSMSFATNVATHITTAQCRAMTAPCFSESSASRPRHALQDATSATDVLAKNQMKMLRQQLKVEAEAAAKRKFSQLSLDNGGGGPPNGGLSKKQRQKANRQAKQ